MKTLNLFLLSLLLPASLSAQTLPGFSLWSEYDEQQMVIEKPEAGVRILINAPVNGFQPGSDVLLVFYALPNGNTIGQTFGKRMGEGDDWHFDIQHIGAQTRYLRRVLKDRTIVVAYIEAKQKSWPAWKAATPDYMEKTRMIVSEVTAIFSAWNPRIVLNGHSGGGRFIFNYIDAMGEIPGNVERIAFLDSDYGYEDPVYGPPLAGWLRSDSRHYLCTLAYNDSVVIYNDKPLVSPEGGTWYRSKRMQKYLSAYFSFRQRERDSLIWQTAEKRRIEFILRTNPDGRILHTRQVEYNGFIQSMLSGTRHEQKGYRYFGPRAYEELISDTLVIPIRRLNIPPRDPAAETGSAFMARIDTLPLPQREEEIFRALSSGNMPEYLRHTVTITGVFADTAGTKHKVTWEVMPDYLSVGNDTDYCRIPMNPYTATRIAEKFGGSLMTAMMSDIVYGKAEVKLTPFNYVPVGNANELVSKFVAHNAMIEQQKREAGAVDGQLIAGIKKDVILSSRIADQPGKVVIYGWHKPGGIRIQPVYSGHVWWYVDYSHGIRLVNNQVLIDGVPALLSDVLRDPLLYTLFSNEDNPMTVTCYQPAEDKR